MWPASTRRWASSAAGPAPPGPARAKPPPTRVWFETEGESVGATGVPGLRDRDGRGVTVTAIVVDGTPARAGYRGQRRGGGAEPDPVLRRERRPGRRHRRRSPPQWSAHRGHGHAEEGLADLFVHLGRVQNPVSNGAVGAAVLRRPSTHARRGAIRAHHSAPPTCLHEALRRKPGHPCSAEGQPERARPAALRRQPADAHRPRRPGTGSRPR